MQSGGGVAEQDVARHDSVAVQRVILLHHADDGAREVEGARPVEPGHLRRLAAGKRHAVVAAPARDALDEAGDLLHAERRAGDRTPLLRA